MPLSLANPSVPRHSPFRYSQGNWYAQYVYVTSKHKTCLSEPCRCDMGSYSTCAHFKCTYAEPAITRHFNGSGPPVLLGINSSQMGLMLLKFVKVHREPEMLRRHVIGFRPESERICMLASGARLKHPCRESSDKLSQMQKRTKRPANVTPKTKLT